MDHLHGIECDAYRVMNDLYSRYDYAQAYIRNLADVHYRPMNFFDYKQRSNVITMFLPFVFSRPLLHWGLPAREFKPYELMAHAFELLEQPGVWIITNQGVVEQQKEHEILKNLSIPFIDGGEVNSPFYSFSIPHYVTFVTKE